eukprot:7096792-Prymnesium_polylepis.1
MLKPATFQCARSNCARWIPERVDPVMGAKRVNPVSDVRTIISTTLRLARSEIGTFRGYSPRACIWMLDVWNLPGHWDGG